MMNTAQRDALYEERKKTIVIKVKESFWRRVRKGAIDRDATITEFITFAVEEYLGPTKKDGEE